MRFSILAPLLLIIATPISANIGIHNWCSEPIYIFQANPSIGTPTPNCDFGTTSQCGISPWYIPPTQILYLDIIANSMGTSVKISKTPDSAAGVVQYEYTMARDGLYWDLSDLDGRGPGLVGTVFAGENVRVMPTGRGVGGGSCVGIRCPAGEVCVDAYQRPDDDKTRWCPGDTGTMWIDLCQPQDLFVAKRGVEFVA